MLRKILIGLGVLITILPLLGFPSAIDAIIATTAGFLIVVLLLLTRRSATTREYEMPQKEAHRVHVAPEQIPVVTQIVRRKPRVRTHVAQSVSTPLEGNT